MAEVLVRYATQVRGDDGQFWIPQACGGVAKDGLWEGWIEFVCDEKAIRSGRETEQPNRDALMYWAQGLTDAYLEGALTRATTTRTIIPREPREVPGAARFKAPAHPPASGPFRPSRAILDPFTTYAQGEELLRSQLNALSADNLVAIVEDYGLRIRGISDMRSRQLVDAIVEAVKMGSSGRRNVGAADVESDKSANTRVRPSADPG
jgi:hypothetical protein